MLRIRPGDRSSGECRIDCCGYLAGQVAPWFRGPALPPHAPISSIFYYVPVLGKVRANFIPVDYGCYLNQELTRKWYGI